MKFFVILMSMTLSLSAFSAIQVCGERDGTAGNVRVGNLDLAVQGRDQKLADQADSFIKGGMQNGRSYCVVVVYSEKTGKITKIGYAYKDDGKTITFCGVRGGTAGNAYLANKNKQLTLAIQGVAGPAGTSYQKGLEAIDKHFKGGTQNGKSYCVVGRSNDGLLASAKYAFEGK